MFIKLRTLLAKRREYKRNATLSAAQFAEMKLVKFRSLIRHVHAHSPYYARIMNERGLDPEHCSPADFPPLTKAMLMANFDEIVTDKRVTKQGIVDFLSRSKNPADIFLDEFRVIHTSGSSGEMGYFVYSKADWARGTAQAMRPRTPQPSQAAKSKRKPGRFRLAFYGAVGGHYAAVTMMSAMGSIVRLFLRIGLYEVNDPIMQTVAELNAYQPDVLVGYTGALINLARKQNEGSLQISPRTVGTAGEGMSASEKAVLEAAFACPATNGYGSSEHLMMGMVLNETASMLLLDDELIYEPAADHTLVTNLFNYMVPLIRYRMADILRPVAIKTNPASPYLEVESVVGRTEIMPVFINEHGLEDSINPISVAEIFIAGVQRFQLQWLGNTGFNFLVCLDPALTATEATQSLLAVEKRWQEILAQKNLRNISFKVQQVDDLPVNPRTRKFQLIVDARNK